MIRVTDRQYWMHPNAFVLLDSLVYNVLEGWDFLLIYTGSGQKRIGKSMLAQQHGYYLASELGTPFTIENIVFGADNLIETAKRLPPRSVIIDDESKTDFSSKKVMSGFYKILSDFMSECGIFNHIIILVAPDFFDFSKAFAVTDSVALVNLKRTSEMKKNKAGRDVIKFNRGIYDIYYRNSKKLLYMKGKKNYDDYNAHPRDTYGEFLKHWVIDEDAYNKKKLKFIDRDRTAIGKKGDVIPLIRMLKERGVTDAEIAENMKVTRRTIINWKNKSDFTLPNNPNRE